MFAEEVGRIFGGPTTRRYASPRAFFDHFGDFVVNVEFCGDSPAFSDGFGIQTLVMLGLYNHADWTMEDIRKRCVALTTIIPGALVSISHVEEFDNWRGEQLAFFNLFNRTMRPLRLFVEDVISKIAAREKERGRKKRFEALEYLFKVRRITNKEMRQFLYLRNCYTTD